MTTHVWKSQRARGTAAALGLLALTMGCGDEKPDPRDDDPPPGDAAAPATDGRVGGSDADAGRPAVGDGGVSTREKVGEFSLQLVAPVAASETTTATPGFTALLGKVFDAPAAETTIWEAKATIDGCSLLIPRVPFCAPACGNGSVCVEDDSCRSAPVALSVGIVTVRGLETGQGKGELRVDPLKNTYQTPASVTLPYPAFAEGDALDLEASGGDTTAFRIEGRGIAPLELSHDGAYSLSKDAPLRLAWTAAGEGASTLQVRLDISHHGGSKGKVECEVPDTGLLDIPASLIGSLLDLGVAGFPTVIVTRSAIGSTQTSLGRVELRTYSTVERPIAIAGLVSCSASDDCPDGQSCGEDLACR